MSIKLDNALNGNSGDGLCQACRLMKEDIVASRVETARAALRTALALAQRVGVSFPSAYRLLADPSASIDLFQVACSFVGEAIADAESRMKKSSFIGEHNCVDHRLFCSISENQEMSSKE